MWRIRKNNLLINQKEKLELHKTQLERLLQIKTKINNNGPPLPFFLRNKLSKKEAYKEKEHQILYENSIIYSRLLSIHHSPSPYSKCNGPVYCPAFDKKRFHYDKKEKEKALTKRNKYYYERFTKQKPYYCAKNQFEINDYENYIKNNISKHHSDNPNIFFCTFKDFKDNLIKKGIKRCNSANKLKKKNCNVKQNLSDYDNYSGIEYGYSSCGGKLNRNNSCGYFNIKKEGWKGKSINYNSANCNNSTGISSRITAGTPHSFTRCQSAFEGMKKNVSSL